MVGNKVRQLRTRQNLSLRALAKLSGLNINTLSLIENGKSSPSVSTLQQLARALRIPISAFFESAHLSRKVVFTPHAQRPGAVFNHTLMQNLGKDLAGNAVQPFVITLEPRAVSGDHMIEHDGHEFVYCLEGKTLFKIDKESYMLEPGDSIVFDSHLPHQWRNLTDHTSQFVLVISPASRNDTLVERHFQE